MRSRPVHLSEAAFRELERHFLGALSVPVRRSLAPVPGPSLLFTGATLARLADCAVDFGTVESPGVERREIEVANLGEEPLTLELRGSPRWLAARWRDGGERVHLPCGRPGSVLELLAEHDLLAPATLEGRVRLLARDLGGEERAVEIEVRLATLRTRPWGRFDFHGSAVPSPFDFGTVASSGGEAALPCVLSFANLTAVPLVVTFTDLPEWLAFEVDGHLRQGPAAGRFFEREAPFRVAVRPLRSGELAGFRRGLLRLATNDPRPAYQEAEIELLGRFGERAASGMPEPPFAAPPTHAADFRKEVLLGLLVLAVLLLGLMLTLRRFA